MSLPTTSQVTIEFNGISLSGDIVHDDDARVLELIDEEGAERLSTNLGIYGADTPTGHVWIKDWSEHTGLAASLEGLGLVEPVRSGTFGPFDSRATLVKVLID